MANQTAQARSAAAPPAPGQASHDTNPMQGFVPPPQLLFETARRLGAHPAYHVRSTDAWQGTSWLDYGQAVRQAARALLQLGVQRGFPTLGAEAFPGHLAVNNQLKAFMEEGGEVYACRFALQALYGQTEKALIEGIRPINPLDVMDLRLLMRREGAMIIDTWTA